MLKTKLSRSILLVAVTLLLLVVFALPTMAAPGSHELITAKQLKGLINSNNVVVIDVRGNKEQSYDKGHIPGAIWVDVNKFYETINGVNKMVASPDMLAELLGSKGISPKTHVVVYAAKDSMKSATRVWWTLEMYGHKNVQVLDGGYEAWVNSYYDTVETGTIPSPVIYPASKLVVNPDFVATLDEVQAALEQGAIVIDTRKQADYNSGHIPGTFLVPEEHMLNADDKTFKNKQELRDYFAGYGITDKTPVIVYCNSGTTATVQYLALTQILGCKDVQNYDGSLNEWDKALKLPTCSTPCGCSSF